MNFFVLQHPKAGDGDAVTDYLPADGSIMGAAPSCSVCGRFLALLPLLPPIRVELESWGSRWGDLAFGPGDQILVTDKLRGLLIESGLVGFVRFDPVEVFRAKRHRSILGKPPDYHLASIQRSGAALDEAASGVIREDGPACNMCRLNGIIKRIQRIVLEPNTWSGEDAFFARGLPGTVLVSERFKRLCHDGELTNCHFVAAQDFGFDHYPHEH